MLDDTLKIIVPLLAVLIPCIGVYWTFRREMLKVDRPSIGGAGMVAIGGAIASQEGAKLYVEEIRALTDSVKSLAHAQVRTAVATEAQVALMQNLPDDVSKVRRKLGEALENDARFLRLMVEALEQFARLERERFRAETAERSSPPARGAPPGFAGPGGGSPS